MQCFKCNSCEYSQGMYCTIVGIWLGNGDLSQHNAIKTLMVIIIKKKTLSQLNKYSKMGKRSRRNNDIQEWGEILKTDSKLGRLLSSPPFLCAARPGMILQIFSEIVHIV